VEKLLNIEQIFHYKLIQIQMKNYRGIWASSWYHWEAFSE
jgi:hypothetical protein